MMLSVCQLGYSAQQYWDCQGVLTPVYRTKKSRLADGSDQLDGDSEQ